MCVHVCVRVYRYLPSRCSRSWRQASMEFRSPHPNQASSQHDRPAHLPSRVGTHLARQCQSIDWVKVLRPTRNKIGHFGDVPKPISWLGMEKLNPTQQKHAFTNQKKCTTTQTTPHHNRFMALFPGPPGWAGARRELLDFKVQGKINRGSHTDHPDGCHSIRTSNQCPLPPSPSFLWAECPSCRPTNSVTAPKATSTFRLGRRR